MKVTYNGEKPVRVYNLDWQPGETKEVANDLDFSNFKEFKVEGVNLNQNQTLNLKNLVNKLGFIIQN